MPLSRSSLVLALSLLAACSGSNPPADTGDTDAIAEEIPYDGIDQDGDGEDLLDVDGDGYAGIAPADYPGTWPADLPTIVDCDDEDASVYPGAPDSPYDGVDSDCDEVDDYDLDGDGYAPDEYAGDTFLPAGDCDDGDPAVHPGASEVFGDGIDQDCAGDADLSALRHFVGEWENPRKPQLHFANGHLLGVFAGDQWVDESRVPAMTRVYPGLLAVLDLATGGYAELVTWSGSATTDLIGEALDSAVDADDNVYVAFSLERETSTTTSMYLSVRGFSWNGTAYSSLAPVLQGVESSVHPLDIDAQVLGEDVVAVGCSASLMQHASGSWSSGSFSREVVGWRADAGGSACILDLSGGASAAVAHVQGTSSPDPKPYLLGASSTSFEDLDPGDTLAGPYEDLELGVVNEDAGLVTYYDRASGNSYLEGDFATQTLFVATEVYDLAAAQDPDTGDLFVLAVTEDRGSDGIADLVLLHGQPGALTERTIDLDGATPYRAGIVASAEAFAFAVATRDPSSDAGAIAWAHMRLP